MISIKQRNKHFSELIYLINCLIPFVTSFCTKVMTFQYSELTKSKFKVIIEGRMKDLKTIGSTVSVSIQKLILSFVNVHLYII